MIDVTWREDRPAISQPNKCREKGVAHPPFSLNLSESLSQNQVAKKESNIQSACLTLINGLADNASDYPCPPYAYSDSFA